MIYEHVLPVTGRLARQLTDSIGLGDLAHDVRVYLIEQPLHGTVGRRWL